MTIGSTKEKNPYSAEDWKKKSSCNKNTLVLHLILITRRLKDMLQRGSRIRCPEAALKMIWARSQARVRRRAASSAEGTSGIVSPAGMVEVEDKAVASTLTRKRVALAQFRRRKWRVHSSYYWA